MEMNSLQNESTLRNLISNYNPETFGAACAQVKKYERLMGISAEENARREVVKCWKQNARNGIYIEAYARGRQDAMNEMAGMTYQVILNEK